MRKTFTALSLATLGLFGVVAAASPASAMPSVEYVYPSADKDGDHSRWDLKTHQDGADVRTILKNENIQSAYPHPGIDGDADGAEPGLFGNRMMDSVNTAEAR